MILDSCRQARIRQAWEQNWRSLRPTLRGNHRPQPGAGQRAAVIIPAISAANCCQMASMSLAGRWRMVNCDGPSSGGAISDATLADTAQGHFIDLVWHEAGFLSQTGGDFDAWNIEFSLIAQAIWDRFQIVVGNVGVVGANGLTYSGRSAKNLGYLLAGLSPTLNNVLISAANGTRPAVLNGQGQLIDNKSILTSDLSEEQGNTSAYTPGRVPLYNAGGSITGWYTQGCYSVIAAIEAADGVAAGISFNAPDQFVTSWNVRDPTNNPNYKAAVEYLFGQAGPTNFFWILRVWTCPEGPSET